MNAVEKTKPRCTWDDYRAWSDDERWEPPAETIHEVQETPVPSVTAPAI